MHSFTMATDGLTRHYKMVLAHAAAVSRTRVKAGLQQPLVLIARLGLPGVVFEPGPDARHSLAAQL